MSNMDLLYLVVYITKKMSSPVIYNDWTFCENWRDLGGKVWVDKRILLKHTGTYTYDAVGQDATYRALHEELKDHAPVQVDPDLGKIESGMPEQQASLPPERRSAKVLAKTTGKKKKKAS